MIRKFWQLLTAPQTQRSLRGKVSPQRRRSPWTTRPTLELLENRLAPAVFTVTNLSDALVPPSGLDLRQAIAVADLAGNAGSTINFKAGLNGTIILQQGELTITQPMTIDATGHTIAVDGAGRSRDFFVNTPGTVMFKNLTIKDGKASISPSDGSGDGGGVYDASPTSILVLTNDKILINRAVLPSASPISGGPVVVGSGGGVFSNGIVRVTGTTIDGNTAANLGGGIYADKSINFTGSTISNNTASIGGGVYQDGTGTTVTLNTTTVKLNKATSGDGGGIYALFNVSAVGGSVNNNTALGGGDGGGIFAEDGNVTLTGTTVNANTATGEGGGIWADFNTFLKTGTVVSNNIGNLGGGGVWADDGAVFMTASTVENNTAGAGTDPGTGDGNTGNGGGAWSGTNVTLDALSIVSGNTANGEGGGIFALDDVTLNGGTVSGNNAVATTQSPTGDGGGIYAVDDVTMNGGLVTNNTASNNGGGIFSDGGSVFLNSLAVVSFNTAGGDGGGVWDAFGNVVVDDSTVTGNESNHNGGGIFVSGYQEGLGSLTVQNSSFITDNFALNEGGGIYVEFIEAVTIDSSTIAGNTASQNGGGISSHDVFNLSITNSSLTGNIATSGSGGALYAVGTSDVYLDSDTFDGNQAGLSGGAVYLAGENGEGISILDATIVNCEFDNNVSYGGPHSGSVSSSTSAPWWTSTNRTSTIHWA